MAGITKKALLFLIVVFTLAEGFGCATASVGLGYHVPVTDRVETGVYFGVGF